MNNTHTIRLKSPLVRPGLEIETQVSKRYLAKALAGLLDEVREFNEGQKQPEKVPCPCGCGLSMDGFDEGFKAYLVRLHGVGKAGAEAGKATAQSSTGLRIAIDAKEGESPEALMERLLGVWREEVGTGCDEQCEISLDLGDDCCGACCEQEESDLSNLRLLDDIRVALLGICSELRNIKTAIYNSSSAPYRMPTIADLAVWQDQQTARGGSSIKEMIQKGKEEKLTIEQCAKVVQFIKQAPSVYTVKEAVEALKRNGDL